MKTKSKRLASIELLRIIAMMMVVMLHYFGKAELLPMQSTSMDIYGYIVWLLYAFCIVAVNVYVLISGYFMVESQFRVSKVTELVLQVMFYTLIGTIIALSTGLVSMEDIGIYDLCLQIFPVQMQQYWFISSYIVLYMLTPVLAAGVKALSQKQLKTVIIMMLIMYCFSKSIFPVEVTLGNRGYDISWFICLFLIAAYIRLYGIKWLERPRNAILLYFGAVIMIYAESIVLGILYEKTGKFVSLMGSSYHYNNIFTLLAALGLFMFFLNIKIPEGKIARVVCSISPYALGVYLMHEQIYFRELWVDWLKAGTATTPITFVLMAFGSVLLVFIVGIVVDFIRSKLFKLIRYVGRKLIGSKKTRNSI